MSRYLPGICLIRHSVNEENTGITIRSIWGPGQHRATLRTESSESNSVVNSHFQPGASTKTTCLPATSPCHLTLCASLSVSNTLPRMVFTAMLLPTQFAPRSTALTSTSCLPLPIRQTKRWTDKGERSQYLFIEH